MTHSPVNTRNHITHSDKLPPYEANFSSHLMAPTIHFNKTFFTHSIDFLKSLPHNFVNSLILDYTQNLFPLFILIFTDGSSSPLSAGYSFYIPELHISFYNKLPPTASSYTPVE